MNIFLKPLNIISENSQRECKTYETELAKITRKKITPWGMVVNMHVKTSMM